MNIAIISNDSISPVILQKILNGGDIFSMYIVSYTELNKFYQLIFQLLNGELTRKFDKIYIFSYATIDILKSVSMTYLPLDYIGGDYKIIQMSGGKNNINGLLQNTVNDKNCVAFNTKGYIKNEVILERLYLNVYLGQNGGIFIYNEKVKQIYPDNLIETHKCQLFIQSDLIYLIPKMISQQKGLHFNIIYTKSQKIKVALCLSGQPRFYNTKSFESLNNFIINEYDTDVFIHSWISKELDYKYEYAPWSKISFLRIPVTAKNELEFLYKPKSIKCEEPRIFYQFYKEGDYSANNIPSMFYSVQQADTLRQEYENKNNFRYDYVIRARTDTLLNSFVDITLLDKNYIHIPNNCPNTTCYNDNFSISGKNISNSCYNTFDILEEYFSKNNRAESMWLKNLQLNNIPVNLIHIDQNFIRE